MAGSDLVRYSRDGDQFHYFWAARRCLFLLSPNSNLKAITIEGASPSETPDEGRITTAEELIDVAEYYGSENIEQSTLIRYIQLKHSTVRTDKAWMPGELEKTLEGFAKRYKALQQHFFTIDLNGKLEFCAASRNSSNPEIAYRLARCAELTHDYVVRDKHFDWRATVEAISALCGKSSLAILSRERTR
jgi:hypothetical protein